MTELKLTRWATYLVPGSVAVFAAWVLVKKLVPVSMTTLLPLPDVPAVDVYAFFVLSYIVGIGLWGVGYCTSVQTLFRFRSHDNRVKYARQLLSLEWRWSKYLARLARYLPERPSCKEKVEEFDHDDFRFAVIVVYGTASPEMKDRVIQDRETIGLLQSLILASVVLTASLIVATLIEMAQGAWRPALCLLCLSSVTAAIIGMLYIHYDRRQEYLVRDVLMSFLAYSEPGK